MRSPQTDPSLNRATVTTSTFQTEQPHTGIYTPLAGQHYQLLNIVPQLQISVPSTY